MTQDEIIEMALVVGTIEDGDVFVFKHHELEAFAALVAAKAIAELESQEPVGFTSSSVTHPDGNCSTIVHSSMPIPEDTLLFTHPPQRTWVGLTNEEIDSYFEDHGYSPSEGYYPVIKDVEAKFKENNG